MVEPTSPSHHPVGHHRRLRAAADLLEQTAARTAPDPWESPGVRAMLWPWVALMEPALANPLAEWLRSAAEDAETIGADSAAFAVADAILRGGR